MSATDAANAPPWWLFAMPRPVTTSPFLLAACEPETHGFQLAAWPAACRTAAQRSPFSGPFGSMSMFWSRNASESIPDAIAIMSMIWASASVACWAPGARTGPEWKMPPVDGTGFDVNRYAPFRFTFIHGEVFSVLAFPPATDVGIAFAVGDGEPGPDPRSSRNV